MSCPLLTFFATLGLFKSFIIFLINSQKKSELLIFEGYGFLIFEYILVT